MDKFEKLKIFIKNRGYLVVSICISIVSILGAYLYVNSKQCEECLPCALKNLESEEEKNEVVETIKVDIKGAVKKTGVYELVKGSNVQDAINVAGGITSNGVTNNINLSKKLSDEMVIYIFNKNEIKEMNSKNNIVFETPKCECEVLEVNKDICANANSTNNKENTPTGMISINTDSIEELTSLDGIGEQKAFSIINYRKEHGNFKSIEEIMNVSGIGQSAFNKIKNRITI